MNFLNRHTARLLTALGAGIMMFGITGALAGSSRMVGEFALAAGIGAAIFTRALIDVIKPEQSSQ